MEHKTTKYLIAIGFLIGFILFLCTPAFAFEGFDIECIPYWNDGTSVNDYFQFADPDIPDSAFYSPSYSGTQATEIGLYTGFPVPYYADGDHYSVFMNFSIAVPAAAIQNNWLGLYIKPQLSNPYMGTSAGGTYIIANIGIYNPYGSSGNSNLYTGSFKWQGKVDCSYKILMSCFIDDGVSVGAQSWIYNFSCVFDLNLTGGTGIAADELRPFAISAKYYLGYPTTGTTNYGLGLYKQFTCRCTDTSLYGLVEDIQSAIADLDFSGLSGLADMSATVTNLYNSYVTNSGIEIGLMESIIDDGETDAEPIQWESQAQQMQSQVEELHSLEEDIKGTFTEYEFPTAPNQTAIGNVANMFFQNELFIALTLAFFTMTLCMMFLF